MKPTGTRLSRPIFDLNFLPFLISEVENPEVIKIGDALASKDDEIGIGHGWGVVGSFPRGVLIGIRLHFSPNFSVPVKDIDCIESFFVIPSSPKNYKWITLFVIMCCTIWSSWWDCSTGFMLFPGHGGRVKGPEIIHVDWVWVEWNVPA